MHRGPHEGGGHILVIMAVDITGTGHFAPGDRGMAGLQIVRQPTRSFGNDLKAACYRIEGAQIVAKRLEAHVGSEAGRELDVMRDVAQYRERRVRTHKSRRS